MQVQKVFVLADIEWNTNVQGVRSPTQLAAVKVDDQWNVVDRFAAFIRPQNESFHNWQHISYTGGSAVGFLSADSACDVLSDFLSWLEDGDVLLWWYDESAKFFSNLIGNILKNTDEHTHVIISDHVYEYLAGQVNSRASAYKLAEARGIDTTPCMEHCSANDVRVMQELMRMLRFPQERLLQPLAHKEKAAVVKGNAGADLCYQYDPSANMIHLRDCDKYDHSDTSIKGYPNFTAAIKKGFGLCSCCQSEYSAELSARNQRIIAKMDYIYVYSAESDVFHRADCALALNERLIMGSRHYKTIRKLGKTPCPVCEPPVPGEQLSRPLKEIQILSEAAQSPTSDVTKAIRRQRVAAEDRERLLEKDSLTKQEMDDIYTLTQPRFAFWAARGYTSFHQRFCHKLNDVSELKGFATYSDAVRAGFRPCRHCKPTAKQDMNISIPITSKQRNNERIEELEPLCREAGYPFGYDKQYFCFETPVGKWRINTAASPIGLKHINLVKSPDEVNYHDQPRLFLSFADAFSYIKRHDEELMKKE